MFRIKPLRHCLEKGIPQNCAKPEIFQDNRREAKNHFAKSTVFSHWQQIKHAPANQSCITHAGRGWVTARSHSLKRTMWEHVRSLPKCIMVVQLQCENDQILVSLKQSGFHKSISGHTTKTPSICLWKMLGFSSSTGHIHKNRTMDGAKYRKVLQYRAAKLIAIESQLQYGIIWLLNHNRLKLN